MNLKIKFRESFRPFAAGGPGSSGPRTTSTCPEGCDSPYMLVVAPVSADRRIGRRRGFERTSSESTSSRSPGARSRPSPTSTARRRVQTVDDARNPLFANLLRAFERRTGCPVLINTSFNVRGEPIVESPADAYRGFLATGVDVLALGHFLVKKADQRAMPLAEVEAHLAQFPLD